MANELLGIEERVINQDWDVISEQLLTNGFSLTQILLSPNECEALISTYDQTAPFRKTINMERHQFGKGEYKYFSYSLPRLVQSLRESLYAKLYGIANRLGEHLGLEQSWPTSLTEFLEQNHQQRQYLATPLMLKYQESDYNCLHQDKYGEQFFPFQAVIVLSEDSAYQGGEFVLVENRPRMQSRASSISPKRGQILLFSGQYGMRTSARGWSKTHLRHGVSTITQGERISLGIIFHDAQK